MKTFLTILIVAILAAPSLSAKILSQREKRLAAKTSFKVDKTVANTNLLDETFFHGAKPEKALRDSARLEKTIRDDKIGREPVLKRVPNPKQRKKTHIREWP